MYGKPGNSGGNSNGTVHHGGNFPEKSNSFRGITFFAFLPYDQNFLYHLFGLLVPGFILRESEKFTSILEVVQLNPIPVFGAKKIPVPFDGNEISIQMVSAPNNQF